MQHNTLSLSFCISHIWAQSSRMVSGEKPGCLGQPRNGRLQGQAGRRQGWREMTTFGGQVQRERQINGQTNRKGKRYRKPWDKLRKFRIKTCTLLFMHVVCVCVCVHVWWRTHVHTCVESPGNWCGISPQYAVNVFYCHWLIKKLLLANGLTE